MTFFSQICEAQHNLASRLLLGPTLPPHESHLFWLGSSPGGPASTGPSFPPQKPRYIFPPMPGFPPLHAGGSAHVRCPSGSKASGGSTDREPWRKRKRACCTSSRCFCPRTERKPCMKDSLRLRYSPVLLSR